MPGPGTGPGPVGWETLVYSKLHNVMAKVSLSLCLTMDHVMNVYKEVILQQYAATNPGRFNRKSNTTFPTG